MILDPDTDRGAEDIELPDPELEQSIEQVPDARKKTIVGSPKGMVEVVEEYSIKAEGPPPSKERRVDDDDWFKQASAKPGPVASGGGAAVAVRDKKKGGTSISKRAEPEKRSNSGRNGVKPSGRMNAVKDPPDKPQFRTIPAPKPPEPEPEPQEEAVEPEPPVRKPSRRMERAGPRPSGRLGKPSASSRIKMTPAAPKAELEPEPAPEVDELAPVESEPKPSDSKRGIAVGAPRHSSRRMKAAKRGAGAGGSNKSIRGEKGEKGEKGEERGRGGKRGGDNMNMMMIGGGVVGIILLVVCVAAFGGKTKAEPKKQTTTTQVNYNYSELAGQADGLVKSNPARAADLYTQAAEQAEAAGNSSQAQLYASKAYQIRKFTTLDMHH